MSVVDTYNRKRPRSSSASNSAQPSSIGSGRGTGSQIMPSQGIDKMGENQRRAETLQAVTGDNDSWISTITNFGLDVYDKSGLDSALEFIDRGKKTINLVAQDNLVASMFVTPLTTLPVFAANLFGEQGEMQADQRYGYEITAGDYWDMLRGNTEEIAERMGLETADALLGVNRDVSGSAIYDANRFFTTEWVNNLPRGIGNIVAGARFAATFGTDMANDPTTYITGGMGGLGRSAAKGVINAAVRTGVRNVADDLVRAGSVKAARSIGDDALKSPLEKLARSRTIDRVEQVMNKNKKLSFDDAVRQESGYTKDLVIRTTDEKGSKVFRMADDDPEQYALQQWADETAGRESVWSEIQSKLGTNMETKFFDDTDEVWEAWVKTARNDPKAVWTTGGLRVGQGQISRQIPWVTDATRGTVRRVVKRTPLIGTERKGAQRVFASDRFKTTSKKWDSLRAKLSREAPEAIRAAQGNSKFTYSAYVNAYREAPELAIKALGFDFATKNIDIPAGWATITKDVKNAYPPDMAEKVLADLQSRIGAGKKVNFEQFNAFPKVKANVEKFAAMYDDAFDSMASMYAKVDPDFAALLKDNQAYRPLSFDEDFLIVAREMSGLHMADINTLIADASGNVTDASRSAFAAKHGITTAELDSYLAVLGTFTDTTSRSRAFGEASELHWRKLGRTGMLLEGESVVGFKSLDEINTSLVKVRNVLADELDFTSKAWKRSGVDAPTVELNPVIQMQRYSEDMKQAIQERAIVGEALRSGLATPSKKGLDRDALQALFSEADKNGDTLLGRMKEFAEDVKEGAKAQEAYQLSLLVDMTPIDIGNGRTINVSKELMQDPDYQKLIKELQDRAAETAETVAQFPHEYERNLRRVKSAAKTNGQELSDAQAAAMATRQTLTGLLDAEARYSTDVVKVINRKVEEAAEAYSLLGEDAATTIDMLEGYMAKQIEVANEAIEGYRQQYIEMFAESAEDFEPIDLLAMGDVDEFVGLIRNAGPEHMERTLQAARRSSEDAQVKLEVMLGEGGSYMDVRNARYELDVASNYVAALEAKLTGQEMSGHGVTAVSIHAMAETATDQEAIDLVTQVIGQADSGIAVKRHSPQLPERLRTIDESTSALFVYGPAWADDMNETFRVLHYAVTGDKAPARLTKKYIKGFWDTEMQPHAGGLMIPRGENPNNVIVVTKLNRNPADSNDQVNYIQTLLRSAQHKAKSDLNLAVEMPNVVSPSFQVTTPSHKQYAVQNIGSHPDLKKLYKGVMNDSQIAELVWTHNKKAAVLVQDSPLTSTQRAARRSRMKQRTSQDLGFEWDLNTERFEYRGADSLLEFDEKIVLMSEEDIALLDESFAKTMRELIESDVAPTEGVAGEFVHPDAEGIIERIRGLQAEGLEPTDPEVTRLVEQLQSLEVEAPANVQFRTQDREFDDIDPEILELEPAFNIGSTGPQLAQPGTERLDEVSRLIREELERFDIDELTIDQIIYDYEGQIIDPNRLGEINLGNIIDKQRTDTVNKARWRVTSKVTTDEEWIYPAGTVLDLPSKARAVDWLSGKNTPEGELPLTGRQAQLQGPTQATTPGPAPLTAGGDIAQGPVTQIDPTLAPQSRAGRAFEGDESVVSFDEPTVPDQPPSALQGPTQGTVASPPRTEAGELAEGPSRQVDPTLAELAPGEGEFRSAQPSLADTVDRETLDELDLGFAPPEVQTLDRSLPGVEGIQQGSGGGVEAIMEDKLYKPPGDVRVKTEQIKTHGDMAEVVSGILGRVFGRTMSPEESLALPATRLLVADINEGIVNATRAVWSDPGVKAAMREHQIDTVKVQRLMDQLLLGDLTVMDDPTFTRFVAVVNDRHTWEHSPEEWAAAHPGATKPTGTPRKVAQSGKATYEVSTAGDKRFSALNATLSDGKTIEYHYQVNIKGYDSIKAGKGKPPKGTPTVTTRPGGLFETSKAVRDLQDRVDDLTTYIHQQDARLAGVRKPDGSLPATSSDPDYSTRIGAQNASESAKRDLREARSKLAKAQKEVSDTSTVPGKPKMPSKKETVEAYTQLWRDWADQNPELMQELVDDAAGRKLSDKFVSKGAVNSQADALEKIIKERGLTPRPVEGGWNITDEAVDRLSDVVQANHHQKAMKMRLDLDQRYAMLGEAQARTRTDELVTAIESIRGLDDVPIERRSEATSAVVDALGQDMDRLDQAAKQVWGSEAQLFIRNSGEEGKPVLSVTTPRSDTAAIDARGGFDEALEQIRNGDMTVDEAFANDMPQIALAYKTEEALKKSLQLSDGSLVTAKRQAQIENMETHLVMVMSGVQDAIERGSAKQLRPLVTRWNGHRYVYSDDFNNILKALDGYPAQKEWLMRYVESGWVADLDWRNKADFDIWWQQERRNMASLDWSLDLNQRQMDRIEQAVGEMQQKLFPADEMSEVARTSRELLENVAQLHGYSRAASTDLPSAAGVRPFATGDIGEAEIRTGVMNQQSRQGARRLQADASYGDTVDNTIKLLETYLKSPGFRKLDAQDAVKETARLEMAIKLMNDVQNARRNPAVTQPLPRAGMVPSETTGLGSGILADLDIDPLFAEFISATVGNTKTLFTPYAISETQRVSRQLINWWKAAATVVKPSFHIRNVIGGVQNGYIAGVHMGDYTATFADVNRFRAAMKRATKTGTGDVQSDVFKNYVLAAVSEPNRAMFEDAWNAGIMQTGFARAEQLYNGARKKSLNPFSTQWAPFQWGGQTMETFEDHMRMAAFHRWYFDDSSATSLGAKGPRGVLPDRAARTTRAKGVVNAVHFDYNNLTDWEGKIKNFMPFYVWTRRNIPLQMRVLTQNPTFMLWYQRARSNWNEQQLADMEDIDIFTRKQSQEGFIMPLKRGNDEAWSRLMWDAQMPAYDLDALPGFRRPGEDSNLPVTLGSFFNAGGWASFITDNAGPHISTAYKMASESEELGSTNAPAGLNAVMRALDGIMPAQFLTGDAYPDATSSIAPDQDYRISKWLNVGLNAAIPFYHDYRAMTGMTPNNPYRASSEGWLPGEDPGTFDPMRIALGPGGRVLGRGAGFGWSTPTDMYFDAVDVEKTLTHREKLARQLAGEGVERVQAEAPLPSEQLDVEAILQSILAGQSGTP